MSVKTSETYDVIIVGSGPGGASVARELSQNNKRILMLEWGDNAKVSGSLFQLALNAGIPGQSLLFTDKSLLAMVRGICTGGSSIFYCATAFDPPYDMLASYGIDIRSDVDWRFIHERPSRTRLQFLNYFDCFIDFFFYVFKSDIVNFILF